jgi:hypothetical protein
VAARAKKYQLTVTNLDGCKGDSDFFLDFTHDCVGGSFARIHGTARC